MSKCHEKITRHWDYVMAEALAFGAFMLHRWDKREQVGNGKWAIGIELRYYRQVSGVMAVGFVTTGSSRSPGTDAGVGMVGSTV